VPTFDSDCEWKNTLALPNGCPDGDGEINAEIICFIVSPGVAMNFVSPLYGYLFLLGPVGSQGAVCMTRCWRAKTRLCQKVLHSLPPTKGRVCLQRRQQRQYPSTTTPYQHWKLPQTSCGQTDTQLGKLGQSK